MVPRPVQLEVAENAASIDLKGSDREKWGISKAVDMQWGLTKYEIGP